MWQLFQLHFNLGGSATNNRITVWQDCRPINIMDGFVHEYCVRQINMWIFARAHLSGCLICSVIKQHHQLLTARREREREKGRFALVLIGQCSGALHDISNLSAYRMNEYTHMRTLTNIRSKHTHTHTQAHCLESLFQGICSIHNQKHFFFLLFCLLLPFIYFDLLYAVKINMFSNQ